MRKIISNGIFLGLIGLIVGYFIFGRVGGDYISISHLINPPENILESLAESISGITNIRQNILISGAVGAGLGLILGAAKK